MSIWIEYVTVAPGLETLGNLLVFVRRPMLEVKDLIRIKKSSTTLNIFNQRLEIDLEVRRLQRGLRSKRRKLASDVQGCGSVRVH